MEANVLKRGDACPNCGGAFRDARVPTDAQRAKAAHKEDPQPLPIGCDTASVEFREEHGALVRCTECGYQARLPIERAAEPVKA